MSSQEYWKNREEEQRKKNIKDEAEYAKEIEKIYANMMDEIQKEINGFYTRYAKQKGSQSQRQKSGYLKWILMHTVEKQHSM